MEGILAHTPCFLSLHPPPQLFFISLNFVFHVMLGRFAAALRDINVWVMNVVSINAPDTLPVIYERGLFGIYHNWCESFSSYPRTYDLLHADHLFSKLKKRFDLCEVVGSYRLVLILSPLTFWATQLQAGASDRGG